MQQQGQRGTVGMLVAAAFLVARTLQRLLYCMLNGHNSTLNFATGNSSYRT